MCRACSTPDSCVRASDSRWPGLRTANQMSGQAPSIRCFFVCKQSNLARAVLTNDCLIKRVRPRFSPALRAGCRLCELLPAVARFFFAALRLANVARAVVQVTSRVLLGVLFQKAPVRARRACLRAPVRLPAKLPGLYRALCLEVREGTRAACACGFTQSDFQTFTKMLTIILLYRQSVLPAAPAALPVANVPAPGTVRVERSEIWRGGEAGASAMA